MKLGSLLAVLTLLLLISGCASQPVSTTIDVSDAWSRPVIATPDTSSMEGSVGAVYLTMRNPKQTMDRFISAESTIAEAVELHQTTVTNGIMNMQMLPDIEIESGGQLELKPGSYHFMLVGLKQDLAPGDFFPLTLRFQDSEPITIDVEVRDTSP